MNKDTSGLIIAAKNDFAPRASAQLTFGSLSRRMRPWREASSVRTAVPWTRPWPPPDGQKTHGGDGKNSRPAVTHWEVLERYRGYTHIRCRLETDDAPDKGTHGAIGHPCWGTWCLGTSKGRARPRGPVPARGLKFVHPRTGVRVELTSEFPEYYKEILNSLPKM